MPLLYSVVSRGNTVLARFANNCTGNFSEITEQVLAQIGLDDSKMTYSHGSFLFHYILQDRIIYLCISDDEFERSRAFLFLNEVKKKFVNTFGAHAYSALPYAMNTEFSKILAGLMKHFSESRDIDTVSQVQGELDDLKDVMVKNIDSLAARGERLELLVNKTESLSASAVTFRKSSRNLANSLFWKNIKITAITAAVILVIVYFVVSIACGGLNWHSCIQNS
ncbi:vesicle-associated membrane protein 7-like [Daphnia pulex]|uniref:vesicle-associated membrane protein 7-like n=1 Tax=Daphnia pulex TaxID=6669 RepID=UPI001EDCF2DA|nr:vesicle-associated membrane protein 7-like [Daphnia pulex]XP_046654032.1 vesicle-associated membrane protein 7-like [Daphnia pulicaria]